MIVCYVLCHFRFYPDIFKYGEMCVLTTSSSYTIYCRLKNREEKRQKFLSMKKEKEESYQKLKAMKKSKQVEESKENKGNNNNRKRKISKQESSEEEDDEEDGKRMNRKDSPIVYCML